MNNLKLTNRELWVDDGKAIKAGTVGTDYPNLDMPFRYFNLVKMQNIFLRDGRIATLVEWDANTIPARSIDYMIDTLSKQIAPFIFRYFKQAWYSEQINDVKTAIKRIEEIQTLNNVLPIGDYLSIERDPRDVPQGLIERLRTPESLDSVSVISAIDNNGNFPLLSIGKNSLLNKTNFIDMQGDELSATKSNQKMDALMTSVYEQTAISGMLFFDECARLVPNMHQNEAIWLRYTRVLAPIRSNGKWGIMSLCLQNLTDPLSNKIFGQPGAEVDIDLL